MIGLAVSFALPWSEVRFTGRVYSGAPAGANLPVPPHRFEGDALIIGEDQEAAS